MTRLVRASRRTARRVRTPRPGTQAGAPAPAIPPATRKRSPHIGSPAEQVKIEVHATGAVATVLISGDLDVISTPWLAARLTPVLASRPRRLIFDLAQVSFIDCAAARLIVSTGRSLPGRPVIRSPGRVARRLLEVTGLDQLCEIETPGQQPAPGHCDTR